jgi:hypothetical protein
VGEQRCPFCGALEAERLDIDGRRFLIFPCLFSPAVDPSLDEAGLSEHLRATYRADDPAFFRGMCDRLHLYVTKGPGARELLVDEPAGDPPTPSVTPG